jgi:hypothetical protein
VEFHQAPVVLDGAAGVSGESANTRRRNRNK